MRVKTDNENSWEWKMFIHKKGTDAQSRPDLSNLWQWIINCIYVYEMFVSFKWVDCLQVTEKQAVMLANSLCSRLFFFTTIIKVP